MANYSSPDTSTNFETPYYRRSLRYTMAMLLTSLGLTLALSNAPVSSQSTKDIACPQITGNLTINGGNVALVTSADQTMNFAADIITPTLIGYKGSFVYDDADGGFQAGVTVNGSNRAVRNNLPVGPSFPGTATLHIDINLGGTTIPCPMQGEAYVKEPTNRTYIPVSFHN
ncbi:MAG: hypothetical protein WCO33_03620 [bacterium]